MTAEVLEIMKAVGILVGAFVVALERGTTYWKNRNGGSGAARIVATLMKHGAIHRDILDELRDHNKESRKQYDDLRTRQEGQGRTLAIIKDRSRGD